MKINKLAILISGIFSLATYAQETQKDTLQKYQNIETVVITGQFEPQSVKKAVHNVRVISKKDIQSLAANNLGDVLNQYLNITVTPNGQTGKSSVSLFGLDSQYFKILVDNIPLVTDTGLGKEVDLSQINLDNVERIEIIEGAMGVTHGANAVSGILNIITKKNSKYSWEISASIQEETAGSEYALFNRGRHIQNLKASHNISDNWYVSLGVNRNDFRGFYGEQNGKFYTENDGTRGLKWLPKEQFTTNATIGYQKGEYRIFYKFDYFKENVDFYNPVVVPVDNYPFPLTHYSKDKRFPTQRFFHHINYYGKTIYDLIFNISASHQRQTRDEEQFNYHILENQERHNEQKLFHSNEVLYSTGTVNNFIKDKWYDFQFGYELVNENSFADGSSGMFRNNTQEAKDIRKRIENYDAFYLSELNITERFSLRPGFRYSFQSMFEDQFSYSLATRCLIDHDIEARLSGGKSYRTPNFTELYTYFVDSNHNIQGNEDLIPEQSSYVEANIKKSTYFDSGTILYNSITSGFMKVDDKISMVLVKANPILQYKYINIDDYMMWNISTDNRISFRDWNISAGFALIGISQEIGTGALGTSSNNDFLYTFNVNTSISYNLSKYDTQFSLYYKHNGKTRQFVNNIDNPSDFVLAEVESYDWLDASVKKTFYNGRFEMMAGVRNILDVTDIKSSASTGIGGAIHGAASNTMMLGYGRSYFLKLTYNLNF